MTHPLCTRTLITRALLAAVTAFILPTAPGTAQDGITTGLAPPALTMSPPVNAPPGLTAWLGSAMTRPSGGVQRTGWTADGLRMFASTETENAPLQCWRPAASADALELVGSLPLSRTWAVSPDGRWLFGKRMADGTTPAAWVLHHADTLEGVWQLRGAIQSVYHVAFSQDGSWLALTHEESGRIVMSILDVASGARVRTLKPAPERLRSGGVGDCATFSRDALIVTPWFDGEQRLARYELGTWRQEFIAEDTSSITAPRMALSKDERWLVLWHEGGYEALERTGLRYVSKFRGEAETRSDFVSGLQSVRVSPDSTVLILSGNGRHKVIRLADRKVLHESDHECMCGDFSVDGKKFWKTCTPFRAVATTSWEVLPEPAPGHHSDVHSIAFSPDGTRLLTADSRSALVWDDPGAKPQELTLAHPGGGLATVVWNHDGKEVWGADAMEFLRWRMEGAAMGKPVGSVSLFPWIQRRESPMYSAVIALAAPEGWCLIGSNEVEGMFELRNPERSGLVRRVNVPSPLDMILRPLVASADRMEFYYQTYKVNAVRPAENQSRESSTAILGVVVGIGGIKPCLVVLSDATISLVDAASLQLVGSIPVPNGMRFGVPSGGSKPGVSPDGRWLFTTLTPVNGQRQPQPALIDLQVRKVAALLPALDSAPHVAAFSPNSRRLAIGHTGGAVSLWDVEKLAAAGGPAPAPPTQTPAPKPIAATTTTPQPPAKSSGWQNERMPLEPYALDNGDAWMISADGCVSHGPSKLDAGHLLVNGQPCIVQAARSRFYGARKYTLIGEVELLAQEGRVRLHRQLRGYAGGNMRWIDSIENLSAEPITLTLAFQSALGAGLDALRARTDRPPEVRPGGILDIAAPFMAVGQNTRHDGVDRFTGLCFASATAPLYPTLRWDETKSAITCEWPLRLDAFERKSILHELIQRRVTPNDEPLRMMPRFSWMNLRDCNITARLPELLNYAPDETERRPVAEHLRAGGMEPDGTKKDHFGFRWRYGPDNLGGMTAELGAERLLELWIDGSPATFAQAAPRPTDTSVPATEASPLRGPVRVRRRQAWFTYEGVTVTHDTVVNLGKEPQTCRVELAVIARERFTHILGETGQPLDLTKPLPVSACGSRIALVTEGAAKPAILLGVGNLDGAARTSTVRLVGGCGLFITHELHLAPGQEVSLAHFASQRPLGAYERVQEGIAELDIQKSIQRCATLSPLLPTNWAAAK